MKRSVIATLVLVTAGSAGSAMAEKIPDCGGAPESQWMSKSDFESKMTTEGYEVKNIKVEDGCYEMYGMKDGKRVEAFFNPVSGEMMSEG